MNLYAFRHWILPDHLSFIGLFIALLLQQWIAAMILYWFTFLYDVAEEQSTTLKKLELWAKQSAINQIVVPKDWRIYVSKSTYAEIQKRPNGKMFIQIQNPENIEIRKEK